MTNSPNALYHSMYLGAPFSAPSSIKSKSITKLAEAITTMKRLIQILISELFVGSSTEIEAPKKLIIKLAI